MILTNCITGEDHLSTLNHRHFFQTTTDLLTTALYPIIQSSTTKLVIGIAFLLEHIRFDRWR